MVGDYQTRRTEEAAAPKTTETAKPNGTAEREVQAERIDDAKRAIEAKGEDAPKQKDGETDKDYELRLSRVTSELKRARAKLSEYEAKAAKADEELNKPKSQRMRKKDYIELTQKLAKGELDPKDAFEEDEWEALPPKVRERIERLEADAKERDEEKQRSQGEQVRQKEVGIVTKRLESLVSELPLFKAKMGEQFASQILDLYYEDYRENEAEYKRTKTRPDLDALIRGAHEGLAATLRAALKDDQARKFLLGEESPHGQEQKQPPSPASDSRGNPDGRTNPASLSPDSKPADPTRSTTPPADPEEVERAARLERFKQWKRDKGME